MEEERDDLAAMMSMMEDASEQSMKMSFFDDGQSMESKRERDKEDEEDPPGASNEEIKNQPKLHHVTINNEDEAVMSVDLRKKKRMNSDDVYYSIKLPKFIGVCPDIGKLDRGIRGEGVHSGETKGAKRVVDVTHLADARNVIDLEGEGRHPHMAKNQKAVISWQFDVDAYNRKKWKKDSHTMKEEEIKKEKQQYVQREDPHRRDEVLEGHSDGSDLPYLTDDDLSDFSNVDELYEAYQVTHNCDDLMSLPSDDPNEKTTILCRNMEFLETNSFIVEYEDGKLIFFINEKPYLLETDQETNYLIELSEMSIMPIHCILEKKIFLKSITREEQGGSQGSASPGMVDVYYSLHG
ncbi:hypothetical protein PCYB_123140 [Plasmodium cynomolgi strain B]|uniref:Uncharacterized protein n=1 Tax=Plasmodium cynomolgi (strain B) TaxID=1120755 RepID=K6ULI4_PLACD|nr:hypothetical protein PCYB_123140 [Plasmodium cynomolgi strain B]GAB67748.1 hypothetical protein PCYB_123140 [Plasmodium cynomolgi strain B]